jgi:hypothetical protein
LWSNESRISNEQFEYIANTLLRPCVVIVAVELLAVEASSQAIFARRPAR